MRFKPECLRKSWPGGHDVPGDRALLRSAEGFADVDPHPQTAKYEDQCHEAVEPPHKWLAKKAKKDAEHLGRIRWPEGPADVQDELRAAISDAHKISKAGTELRAVLSAYAHRVHEPRPVISDLARAQDTGSQGFMRRYSDATLAAVQQLVSDTPDIETVRAVSRRCPSTTCVTSAGRSATQPSGASQRMRARGATCENFLYSFKAGFAGCGASGASGPRSAAVRALLVAASHRPVHSKPIASQHPVSGRPDHAPPT